MFNKMLGYFKYRDTINSNLDVLKNRYKLKYDKLYGRLYTVLSIPPEQQEVLRTYGFEYLENELEKYKISLEKYFNSINLLELISISKIQKIDDVNVLIVLRYRYIKSQKWLYFWGMTTGISIIAGLIKLISVLLNFIL